MWSYRRLLVKLGRGAALALGFMLWAFMMVWMAEREDDYQPVSEFTWSVTRSNEYGIRLEVERPKIRVPVETSDWAYRIQPNGSLRSGSSESGEKRPFIVEEASVEPAYRR